MKFNKKDIKAIFLLVICVFIIIPIILLLFDINPFNPIQEGATFEIDGKNQNMSKINIKDIDFKDNDKVRQLYKDSTQEIDNYLWCPGGNIEIQDDDDGMVLDVKQTDTSGTYEPYGIFTKSYKHPYNMDNSSNWYPDYCSSQKINSEDQCKLAVAEMGADLSSNINDPNKPSGCFYDVSTKSYHYNNSDINTFFDNFTSQYDNSYEGVCISGGLTNNLKKRKFVNCNNYLGTTTTNSLIINTDLSGTARTAKYPEFGGTNGGGEVNSQLAGFIGPFTSTPMDISGDSLLLYGEHNENHNQNITTSSCFLYDTNINCATFDNVPGEGTNADGTNTDGTNTDGTCSSTDIKCVADNGSKIGDPLCCGQTGVVQNTNNLCPSEYPKCVGYECGKSWGKCKKA